MAKRPSLTSLQGMVSSKSPPSQSVEAKPVDAPKLKARSANLFVEVDDQTKAALKILAIEQGSTVKALMHDAINDLFRKHGKPPLA